MPIDNQPKQQSSRSGGSTYQGEGPGYKQACQKHLPRMRNLDSGNTDLLPCSRAQHISSPVDMIKNTFGSRYLLSNDTASETSPVRRWNLKFRRIGQYSWWRKRCLSRSSAPTILVNSALGHEVLSVWNNRSKEYSACAYLPPLQVCVAQLVQALVERDGAGIDIFFPEGGQV